MATSKNNIVIIGMPSSGKSTIGILLSELMNFSFLDCDDYIKQMEGMTLQQIIDERGVAEFKKIEQARIMELNVRNCVIAPGGSVVYYPKAVNHLKKSSIFIFLNVCFSELESRLKNAQMRGIVGLKNKTFKQLFNERLPLYLKCADIIIDCSGKSKQQIAKEACKRITEKMINDSGTTS